MVLQSNPTKSYNPIFEKLVISTDPESKERLIGMLAYAEYKEEKYSWKEHYRSAKQVTEVPDEDVRNFLLAYQDERLDKLRNNAEELLYVFAEHYSEEVAKATYKQALEDELLKAVKENNTDTLEQVSSAKDSWPIAILKGALGSLAFSFVVFCISLAFSVANPDSNYSKLFQFIIGGKDFDIIPQVESEKNQS
ncbi:MAG: hypothetical protein DSY86_07425 [Marinomonas sp.]|uniref:hypothetical protein n=1 Tax=Marinomonas communis TaxID=28254 RepID=UPI001002B76D|nr:hypothetical protein [Marinomonas communis]MCC4273585.1 hypothetical protein [Marinomonas communis]RUM50530.1 MAG: hypothetical protein DSY86_07425 [Marinomonas sp.]